MSIDTGTVQGAVQAGGQQPQPSSASVGGITFTAPSSSGSGADLYGLGPWAGTKMDVTGFPADISAAIIQALQAQIGASTTPLDLTQVTGAQIAQAIAQIKDPGTVAKIQQMLWYSGFYPSSTSMADLKLGIFGQDDETAIKNAVQTAGRNGTPLGSYLQTSTAVGYAQGALSTLQQQKPAPGPPAQADEDYALRVAANQVLGRAPTQSELAGFRAFYDQAYKQAVNQLQASQQPTALNAPDVGSLAGALARTGQVPGVDQAVAPPQTVRVGVGQSLRNPDFEGQTVTTNPDFTRFQTQQQTDANTLGQFNNTVNQANASGGIGPSQAPDLSAAAQQFLYDNNAGDIRTQNALTAYGSILNFIKGDGSIQ